MAEIQTLSSGINQTGVRAFNERLLLSVLQRNGALPGSELARRTGLSPQTTSVILRKLENDGLLSKKDPVKGKVGKPSVPFSVNPDGIFAIGLKIGRRSADLLVLDFAGRVRAQLRQTYDYPMPDVVFDFLGDGVKSLSQSLPGNMVDRICGIGIAAPFELWNWHELVGAPAEDFLAWREVDFADAAAQVTDLPIFLVNDATAACRAEHVFGGGKVFRDYAYFFMGAFIGGGVVLDHSVFEGNQRNAGALGSLPSQDAKGRTGQLIDFASIHTLEQRLAGAGQDPRQLWAHPQDWSPFENHVSPWIEECARHISRAALAACSVIDFEAVLIDGAMPAEIRHRLVNATRAAVSDEDARGLVLPQIVDGQIGGNARAIGAAAGPILATCLLDRSSGLFEGLAAAQ